jgi:D-alanyl-lipoteichoic acid acyltransferase DltB (MBOAT superfamily)
LHFATKHGTETIALATASLRFLAYALAVAVVFNFRLSVPWRQFVLLAASIGFLGFFSHRPAEFVPLAAFLLFGFLSLRLMQAGATRLFVPLVIVAIVSFIWLKKYAFIPSGLFLRGPYVTLGLSYMFFRVLHLIIDARSNHTTLARNISLVSYLNYALNFTTLVSGPIQRYNQFASMQLAPAPLPLNVFIVGRALERIIVGFFKVNVLSLFLLMIHTSALNSLPAVQTTSGRVFTAITIVAVYPLYIYCNFSGYIDIVIGIARFLRIQLPENFNRPFSSQNYMIFWSRWHITLSTWFQIYVYGPIMLWTLHRWRATATETLLNVLAFFLTFFLVGLWHGQTSSFIFFGLLLGLGVSVTKLYQVLMMNWMGRERYSAVGSHWFYNTAARGLTYTWCALTILWFWSGWTQLSFFARSLGSKEIALVWIAIFVGSSITLSLWESVREWLLSFQFENQPVLSSRYVRTVWDTTLVVISIATMILMNAPPPDIIYKTF